MPCFAELVGRFETRIFNFLRRRTTVATDAEDLTQDTFMRAWERIGQYEPGRRFSTWLFTVAARLAITLSSPCSANSKPDQGSMTSPEMTGS